MEQDHVEKDLKQVGAEVLVRPDKTPTRDKVEGAEKVEDAEKEDN